MPGLGGFLRGLPAGLVMILLASGIMAVGAFTAKALDGNLVVVIADEYDMIEKVAAQYGCEVIWHRLDGPGNYTYTYNSIITFIYDNGIFAIREPDSSIVYNSANVSKGLYNEVIEDYIIMITEDMSTAIIGRGANLAPDTIPLDGVYSIVECDDNVDFAAFDADVHAAIENPTALDLGFIPGVAVTFGGLYLFLRGLRLLTRTRW